jgi:hypothetical protein
MEIENWERMVVVTAVHGEKFMGWVPKDKGDPKKYMAEQREKNQPAILHEVRNYLTQAQPNINAAGQLAGVAKLQVLLPLDMFPAALQEMHVLASCWYFPSDNDGCKKPIQDLMENARQNEKINDAIAAGITPAGDLDGLPPPPGAGRKH